jgi:hypothetical protein
MSDIDPLHVRLLLRHPNTHHDIKMLPWDGIARILAALLSDGATGHERQFCDTKTGRRILSSEKGSNQGHLILAGEGRWRYDLALRP